MLVVGYNLRLGEYALGKPRLPDLTTLTERPIFFLHVERGAGAECGNAGEN